MSYPGPPWHDQRNAVGEPVSVPGVAAARYPAPSGGPFDYDGVSYPMPVSRSPVRLAPRWTGGVLAGAGVVTVIGSFLTWVTLVITGLHRVPVAGTDDRLDGTYTAFLGVVMVALGILILAGQGRLWVGIVGIVVAPLVTLEALSYLGRAGRVRDILRIFAKSDIEAGPGLFVVMVAGLIGVAAAIVAVTARNP